MVNQKTETLRLARTALVFLLLYIGIMITMSCIPGKQLENTVVPTYSGLLHFVEFMGLALIGSLTFALYDKEYFFTNIVSLVVVMSALTEGIQYYIPGRVFSIADFVVNIAGGLTFIIILIFGFIISTKTISGAIK